MIIEGKDCRYSSMAKKPIKEKKLTKEKIASQIVNEACHLYNKILFGQKKLKGTFEDLQQVLVACIYCVRSNNYNEALIILEDLSSVKRSSKTLRDLITKHNDLTKKSST